MKTNPVLFYKEGSCALGALISLIWLDEPFKLSRLESSSDTENSDYLKLNALGEVPTMFMSGEVLTENSAILQHIGLRGVAKGLNFEAGSEKYDQVARALGFLSSSFHKAFGGIFNPGSLHPDKKIQKEITEYVTQGKLREMMNHVEVHLLRSTLMYDHPTVPDAYLYATSRWAKDLFDIPKQFPHIARFQAAMEKNPGVQKALKIEEGKLKEADGSFGGHLDFKTFAKQAAEQKEKYDLSHGNK